MNSTRYQNARWNQWRQVPAAIETEEELIARVRNHVQYWIVYFNHGLKTNAERLRFEEPARPFTFAVNGLAIKKFDQVPKQ